MGGPRRHSRCVNITGLFLAAVACFGCDDDEPGVADAIVDAGPVDASADVADLSDAAVPDAAVPDAQAPDAAPRPYPEPGAWPPNRGPGGPAMVFDEADLYENCAFLAPPDDTTDLHNIVTMYDGFLIMPWAPEVGLVGGLSLYDVSDPCDPQLAGHGFTDLQRESHAIGFSHLGGAWAVTTHNERLLQGGILFWDLSDTSAPVVASALKFEDHRYPDAYARVVLSVFWQAPYVYVAGADNGVYVVDATDPRDPQLVHQEPFEPTLRAGQVKAIGNLLVVTAAEGARTVLLDISDPARPQPIPGGDYVSVDRDGTPRESYFSNVGGPGYVYYMRKDGGGGPLIYDISDPTHPTFVGDLPGPGNGGYISVHEGFAITGESRFSAIYDVRDPTAITEVARLHLEGDLDTATPIGNVVVLSVDDDPIDDQGSAIAPWQTDPDSTPPVVTWGWPADGATGLAPSSRFGLMFSEQVDVKSAWAGSVRLYESDRDPAIGRVDGHVSAQENVVNFWPAAPLKDGTRYTLEVPAGGVVDFNGNPIAEPYVAHFTVGGVMGLTANAGPDQAADVGAEVTLDGTGSVDAVRHRWDFGNGQTSDDAVATIRYDTPGRYRATLTVFDAADRSHSATALVTITWPATWAPRHSATLVRTGPAEVAFVHPDANQVLIANREGVRSRIRTCRTPRTVAPFDGRLAVACQGDDSVRIGDRRIDLPRGSRPFGVVASDDALYVTLQGTGELARIDTRGELTGRWPALTDARGAALLPDGRVAVSRWRSPDHEAQIAVVDPTDGTQTRWTLAFDDQLASDTEVGGVPSYLDAIVLSPTGREAALPSLQANIGQGLFRNGERLTHETTLRAVVSFLDPRTGTEAVELRKQFDNRGLASAATYSARGDYLFLAMRGARAVERLDRLDGTPAGSIIDVGFAPDGLALSADDATLFVNASLSRELVLYDVTDFRRPPTPIARIPYTDEEPLTPEHLRGKQLFNDSFDTRISKDGYIACAHCHLDGETDNRVWDFTDRGEGLRNTTSLLGRAGAGHGPIHWSANFDEIHDFEHDMRGPFRGTGLMDDADFHAADRDRSLGGPKAGISPDLDALAAYVTSLDTVPPSPHPAHPAGEAVFVAAGCAECHPGPTFTDSVFTEPGVPLLHDVGTLGPGSGQRLGGELPGIDTPTLLGMWDGAPFLHDGSAATLEDVLARASDIHGDVTALTPDETEDLVRYLLSLDGRER